MRKARVSHELVLALALLLVGVSTGPLGAAVASASSVPSASIPAGFSGVVVFATNSIHVKNGVVVVSGDLIANSASPGPVLASGAELTIGPSATASATSTLKADSVRIRARTQVNGGVHYNDLFNQGTIGGTLTTPLALPVFSMLPPFGTSTPGALDVVVPPGGTATLPPGDYRLLSVGQGAEVVFTGGSYSFLAIAADARVMLRFDAPAEVKVADKLATGPDAFIGPSPGMTAQASRIVFFVAGVNGTVGDISETPSAAEVGPRNLVRASFYVPNGTLHLQNGTSATGAFLGRDVVVGSHASLTLDSAFRPPVAVDDSATVNVGGTVTVLDSGEASVLTNDENPKGGLLTVTTTPVSGPSNGTLVLDADGTFSYTHNGSDTFSDSFEYEVCDQGFPVFCDTATVSITVTAPSYTVTVQKGGSGGGQVTSTPAGIDCGSTCSASFGFSVTVVLNPIPDEGSFFAGWSGDPDCADGIVTGPGDVTCIATFDVPGTVTLMVRKEGGGTGFVGSEPPGIDCGSACSATFAQFSRAELSAVADPGSVFVGFGGDPDCADGFLSMNVSKSCTATFELLSPPPPSSILTIVPQGTGMGTITSDPRAIQCGAVCEAPFEDGTVVTLFARPEPDSFFVGWGGDCAGTSFSTTITIGPDQTCTATFDTL